MSFRRGLGKLLLLTWAFALAWFYLGSLVNFHQHQISKKQLIPQLVASLKQKEKNKTGQKITASSGFADDDALNPAFSPAAADPVPVPLSLISCCIPGASRPFVAIPPPAADGGGLRAPPLA